MKKFWGIPLPVCALFCALMTMLWCFVWPRDRALSLDPVRYFILRWFHALTWMLLCCAALAALHDQLSAGGLARWLSLSPHIS